MSAPSQPFTILDVSTDAFCDPDTGVCAVPLPTTKPPTNEETATPPLPSPTKTREAPD
ncbi:hypothetical protein [Streptomyces shenzhenensis]|uniref:hypothetical protein n=1 Tax=Streptomyces shenzhenensis TaxID=943815 RepID=UPI0033EB6517